MRILLVTAGAANMYCGSCLRDNTLAKALRRAGHDVLLLPLYTPTRTDEANLSHPRVFFGGISVYLQQHVPLMRATPAWLDWPLDRPSLIRAASGRSVRTEPALLGALTVSMLRGEDGYQRKEVGKLTRWLARQPAFDVAVLPNTLLAALAPPLRRALNTPVICTLQGEDLFLDGLSASARTEALALIAAHCASVTRFAAVSRYYARYMANYLGVPGDRIDVVPLGIDAGDFAPGARRQSTPFTIGYLARIEPAKGLLRLCRVYALMRRTLGLPPARLRVAGYLAGEHRAYFSQCEQVLAAAGLAGELTYVGEPDRAGKIAFLHEIDVLSVPTVYAEPKGLFVLEAMAAGVPVVQPRLGAFPEILDRTGGGVLVEDDDDAIASALVALWRDRDRARQLGQRAASGVRAHYHADAMAEHALRTFERAVREHADAPPVPTSGGPGARR